MDRLETFGKKRREWLATFLELRGGIPSHDTFRRVFGLLDRKQFAACLLQWPPRGIAATKIISCTTNREDSAGAQRPGQRTWVAGSGGLAHGPGLG